jgi:hypothetical protein
MSSESNKEWKTSQAIAYEHNQEGYTYSHRSISKDARTISQ